VPRPDHATGLIAVDNNRPRPILGEQQGGGATDTVPGARDDGDFPLQTCAHGARILRSQTLSLRNRDFIQAARVGGEPAWRIILGEIMPNMIGLIAFNFIGAFVYGILFEAGLEFLGLGDTNAVSWGTILYWAQQNSTLYGGAWWHFLFSGLAIALTATACIFINYGLDVISNPRLRTIKDPKAHKVQRPHRAAGMAGRGTAR